MVTHTHKLEANSACMLSIFCLPTLTSSILGSSYALTRLVIPKRVIILHPRGTTIVSNNSDVS